MKIALSLFLFLAVTIRVSGQDIKYLEYELSYFKSEENYGDKIKLAKLLHKKDPFNRKAIKYICDYYSERKIDSVNYFFRTLVNNFPNDATPYVLWAEHIEYDEEAKTYSQSEELKLQYLLKAIDIDEKNIEANYLLANFFYEDFIFPLKKSEPVAPLDYDFLTEFGGLNLEELDSSQDTVPRKSTYPDASHEAFKYYSIVWDLSVELRPIIFYPIKQLQCYLNKNRPKFKLQKPNYFPHGYFMNLESEWECNFTIDYLFLSESSKHSSDFKEEQLIALEEEPLLNNNLNDVSYRLTYLPSFKNPVVIKLQKINEKYFLTWKIGKGRGGYSPEGIKERGKTEIKLENWQRFISLIEDSNYHELPNYEFMPMTDGERWMIEYASRNNYIAKSTNWPTKAFTEAALYLFELAQVEINTK